MIPNIASNTLEAVCSEVADTTSGLTGVRLERLLDQAGIDHGAVSEYPNKRSMLYDALQKRQAKDQCANNVVAFLELALSPASYVQDRELFDSLRARVNEALAFAGLHVDETGKVILITVARTLDEAATRANAMQTKLRSMGIHQDVLKYCRRELFVDKNYFHSVLEATKGVAERIRHLSGLGSDGAQLADDALAAGKKPFPILAVNTYTTSSDKNEQTGVCLITKGLFSLYRNPTAHDPKGLRAVTEVDALLAFQLASVIHTWLDRAYDTRPALSAMTSGTAP